jgi:conjugative relaxase-like TrwC/TraI family protein
MLSLANIKSSGAAAHYYENDDYYAKDSPEHKERSEWFGKGAEKLGLKGNIDKEDFKQVLEGDLPNGEVLGRQENSKRVHAPGIDLTFSAPKSVSIQAEVYGDTRIYAAHKKAVLTALDYVEENLVETRKTIDGELKYEKVNNITVAMFRHNTSRNLDPQLHTHCVLANAIERADKQWKSAFFGKIFENKKFIGQIYRAELAYELKQLGYELRITGKDSSFELKKIPEGLIKLFSSRSKEINNAAESIGVADAKAKAKLTLKTRNYKKDVSKEVLQVKWQETIRQYEATQENQVSNKSEISAAPKVIDYLSNKWEEFCKKFDLTIVSKIKHISDDIIVRRNLKVEERAVEYAIAHLSERSAVWEATALRSVAMEYATGHVCYEKLEAYIQKLHKEGILLQGKKHDGLLATHATLSKELETVDLMKQGKGKVAAIYTQAAIQERLNNTSLRQGQREATALILGTKDRVVGVQGYAGVGKTYMLQHVRALAADSGYTIIGMAPSSSAAKTLEDDTGIKSQTVHKFLFKYDGVIHGRATQSGIKDMKEEFKKTIIVLDEASLASTSQINGLMKISKELDVRVVLAGDIKQIEAVESGKPFYQLQRFGMSTACMSEIIRQDSLKLKGAIYNTIDSEITSAMKKLSCSTIEIDKDKITHELQEASGNRELRATEVNNAVKGALVEEATKTWIGLSKEERKETLVISPSHSIREEINAGIRHDLINEGTLKGEEKTMHTLHRHGLTDVQYSHYNNYKVGNVVLFNRSYSKLGVGKNEYLQVDRIDDKHGILYLKKQDGKTIKWRPDKIAGARKGSVEVYEPKVTPIRIGEQLRWCRNSRSHPEVINARMFEITGLTATDISIRTETGESKVMKLNDLCS